MMACMACFEGRCTCMADHAARQREEEREGRSDQMAALNVVMPEGLDEEQQALWRRMCDSHVLKDDIRREIRRSPDDTLRYRMSSRHTKEQLLHLLVTGEFPPIAPRAARPEPAPLVAPEPWVMPGPDATREEMIAALTAQTDYHVAKLTVMRTWIITRGRRSGGSSGRYCGGGMNEFLKQFGLPEYFSKHDYGYSKRHAEPREVKRPEYPDFEPQFLTDEGLRWHLERRQAAYDKVFADVRDYALARRSYLSMAALNEGLALIGQPPYVPPQQAQISVGMVWKIPDDAQLSGDDIKAWIRDVQAAVRATVTGAGRDGWRATTGSNSGDATVVADRY